MLVQPDSTMGPVFPLKKVGLDATSDLKWTEKHKTRLESCQLADSAPEEKLNNNTFSH